MDDEMTTQDTISTNGEGSVELLTVLFRTIHDGAKYLRAMPVEATTDDIDAAASALGALSWTVLGTVELPINGTVTECDYLQNEIIKRRTITAVAS